MRGRNKIVSMTTGARQRGEIIKEVIGSAPQALSVELKSRQRV